MNLVSIIEIVHPLQGEELSIYNHVSEERQVAHLKILTDDIRNHVSQIIDGNDLVTVKVQISEEDSLLQQLKSHLKNTESSIEKATMDDVKTFECGRKYGLLYAIQLLENRLGR